MVKNDIIILQKRNLNNIFPKKLLLLLLIPLSFLLNKKNNLTDVSINFVSCFKEY